MVLPRGKAEQNKGESETHWSDGREQQQDMGQGADQNQCHQSRRGTAGSQPRYAPDDDGQQNQRQQRVDDVAAVVNGGQRQQLGDRRQPGW